MGVKPVRLAERKTAVISNNVRKCRKVGGLRCSLRRTAKAKLRSEAEGSKNPQYGRSDHINQGATFRSITLVGGGFYDHLLYHLLYRLPARSLALKKSVIYTVVDTVTYTVKLTNLRTEIIRLFFFEDLN